MRYLPLRVHTSYTVGSITVKEIVEEIKKNNFPAVALTDIRGIYGWGELKRYAEEMDLKPIYGVEIPSSGFDLVLLLKNKRGYYSMVSFLNNKFDASSFSGSVGILIPKVKNPPLSELISLFDEGDLYLGLTEENKNFIKELTNFYKFPLVYAEAIEYLRNKKRHFLLKAIRGKRILPKRLKEETTSVFEEETDEELIKNSYEIIEKCEFSFDSIIPSLRKDIFPYSLKEKVEEKLKEKRIERDREFEERIRKEIEAIERSGFAPYFLFVERVVSYMKEKGIFFNLKGSGASSLIAYILDISHINPLQYDLYFERFLNPGRPDPPDIDIDIDSRKRDEVTNFLFKWAEKDRKFDLLMVATFKTYKARSALYDVARAYGLSPSEARKLSEKAPHFVEPSYLLKIKPPGGYEEIWKLASTLDGIFYNKSLHVGGVLITPYPSSHYLPKEPSEKGFPMTHLDKETVEDLKLIKLDLLSVRGLSVIKETMERAGIENIPQGDEETYSFIGEGKTIGCAQIESPGMIALLRRMKPKNLNELAAALALIRPGPTEVGMKRDFLLIRERRKEPDPLLKEILKETSGILLYEEQVMQIAQRMCGMDAPQADLMRRDVKKKRNLLKWKEKFEKGALDKGYSHKEIEKVWNLLISFSSYSFNKSHSISYAWMAYQAAYLKLHYPKEYFASLINSGGGYYPIWEYIEEARRWGIKILPPCVNRSDLLFTVEGNSLRMGLLFIKGIERSLLLKIVRERERRKFASLLEFIERIKPREKDLWKLAESGALDSLEPNRSKQFLWALAGGGSLRLRDHEDEEKEKMEKERTGFSISKHPLEYINRRPDLRIKDLFDKEGEEVEFAALVVDFRIKKTSKGRKGFLLLEDETGIVQGIIDARELKHPVRRIAKIRGIVRNKETPQIEVLRVGEIKIQ